MPPRRGCPGAAGAHNVVYVTYSLCTARLYEAPPPTRWESSTQCIARIPFFWRAPYREPWIRLIIQSLPLSGACYRERRGTQLLAARLLRIRLGTGQTDAR